MSSKELKPNLIQLGPDGEMLNQIDPETEAIQIRQSLIQSRLDVQRERNAQQEFVKNKFPEVVHKIEVNREVYGNYCIVLENLDHLAVWFLSPVNTSRNGDAGYLVLQDGDFFLYNVNSYNKKWFEDLAISPRIHERLYKRAKKWNRHPTWIERRLVAEKNTRNDAIEMDIYGRFAFIQRGKKSGTEEFNQIFTATPIDSLTGLDLLKEVMLAEKALLQARLDYSAENQEDLSKTIHAQKHVLNLLTSDDPSNPLSVTKDG